jgi:DNA-binding IclR family transcriptional regulator
MQNHTMTAGRRGKRIGPNYDVPSLRLGFQVLEKLSAQPRGRVLTDLAAELDCPVSSAYRIVMALEELGLVSRDPETKQIRMTQKLLLIGQRAITETNLVEQALDIMRELRDVVVDTVLIGVREGAEIVVLDEAIGSRMFCFVSKLGYRVPAYCSAPGKAMLAFLPEQEREAVLTTTKLVRFNARTITNKEALRRELAAVVEKGYAFDNAEQFDGVYCIGAPVFDRAGYPVATIWTTGLMMEVERKRIPELGAAVRVHADRISARLGFDHGVQPLEVHGRKPPAPLKGAS